jgi:hypothetical protein
MDRMTCPYQNYNNSGSRVWNSVCVFLTGVIVTAFGTAACIISVLQIPGFWSTAPVAVTRSRDIFLCGEHR